MQKHGFYDFEVYDIVDGAVLADNGANTFVLLYNGEFDAGESDLLNKIMGAVKISSDEFTVISFNKDERMRLADSLDPGKKANILLFGLTPERVGLQIAINKFHFMTIRQWSVLQSVSLTELLTNENAKRLLWRALKSHLFKPEP